MNFLFQYHFFTIAYTHLGALEAQTMGACATSIDNVGLLLCCGTAHLLTNFLLMWHQRLKTYRLMILDPVFCFCGKHDNNL